MLPLPSVVRFPHIFVSDAWSQWETFAYADTTREVKRVAVTSKMNNSHQEASNTKGKKKKAAWSAQTERKEGRQKRQEKRMLKKSWLTLHKTASISGSDTKSTRKRDRDEVGNDDSDLDANEWVELAREEKMAKRLRKGKISQREFDAEFGALEGLLIP